MPGRSQTPLFELLSKDRPSPANPQPADPSVPPPPPPPAPDRIPVSRSIIYGSVAVFIASLVLCWTIAYRKGYRAGQDAWVDSVENTVLTPSDPLRTPRESGASDNSSSPTPNPRPLPTEPDFNPAILAASGPLPADPRLSGHNYLELATLTRPQAESAIAFLDRQRIAAIAVAIVDSGRRDANNPVRYRLVSMNLAIQGADFRRRQADRENHEAQIKRLGTQWKNSGGASDFAQPLWKRHP